MLSEEELNQVAFHNKLHEMGMCTCPCLALIFKIGEALKTENELRVKLAKVSPEAYAALTIGAAHMDDTPMGLEDDLQHGDPES